MEQFFNEKWAVILGASSGFGRATALRLAEAGLNILGVHLDRKSTIQNAVDTKTEIEKLGRKVKFLNTNAASLENIQKICDELESSEGKESVKVLFHSIAFGNLKNYLAEDVKDCVTQAQMNMTLDVMANSLVYWTQALDARGLFDTNSRVYAMTSAGSSRVWKGYGPVSAAKSALESHCRQLALELAPKKVTANAILAGVTDTAALRKIPGNEEMIKVAEAKNPFGRLTLEDDVAKAVVAFSHPYCQFVTGNVIRVDGGENIVE